MRLLWDERAWEDYLWWQTQDKHSGACHHEQNVNKRGGGV